MPLSASIPTGDTTNGISIADERLINAGQVLRNANGTPRLGIIPAHTNPIVTALASMAVSVAAFVAIASRIGGLSAEKVANNGPSTITLSAAPSSGARLDVVWFLPRFSASGDSANTPVFGKTDGVAAADPQKQAIPAGALELATIRVPANATSTQASGVVITQTFLYTAAAGGTVLLRNDDEMAAYVPVAGTQGFRLDTRQMWSYDGSNWTLAQPGLVLIRPSGVAGGSIDSTGTILATGGNSIRIDDCFSARYRHYRVIVSARLSGPGNMRINLTRGGVDRSQNNYFTSSVYSPSFAAKDSQALTHGEYPNTNWFLQVVASTKKMLAMDIFNPMQGVETFASGMYASFGSYASHQSWSGSYETSELNDGLRLWIFENGITFSSVDIKIYAYA